MSPEIIPAVFSALLLAIIGIFSYTFFRRIRRVMGRNEESKTIVSNIVTEFNRRAKEQAGRIETAQKDAIVARRETQTITSDVHTIKDSLSTLSDRLEDTSKSQIALAKTFIECNERIERVESSYDALRRDISSLGRARIAIATDDSREGAFLNLPSSMGFGRLTPTELQALQVLAEEGPLPATTIQERISKTREHTSRLMKKLFEQGYVERNTDRVPYTYAVNDKLKKGLKKPSEQVAEEDVNRAS